MDVYLYKLIEWSQVSRPIWSNASRRMVGYAPAVSCCNRVNVMPLGSFVNRQMIKRKTLIIIPRVMILLTILISKQGR